MGDLIAAICEATAGRGGFFTVNGDAHGDDWIVEWWHPGLVTACWTQEEHRALDSALREAAERLGVEVTP